MSLLSKVYTLQPAFSRTLIRSHSTKSTHFLNEFMTSKEKGPIQISIENKVSSRAFVLCSVLYTLTWITDY